MSIFDELAVGVVAFTAADTRAIARRVAMELPPDQTLALAGDLGTGKTTFVQGLAAAWGVREPITSPSFTVCNIHRGDRLLVHVDAYRLEDPGDWDGLMVEEFLASPWCLAIEWPASIGDRIPTDTRWIRFEMKSGDRRFIRQVSH